MNIPVKKKKKYFSVVLLRKNLNAYVLPTVSQKDQSTTRTSYPGLQTWILLPGTIGPVYAPFFATIPRTPQCPLSHGTDKLITQLKCREMSIHPRGRFYSQDLALSCVSSACISHGLGKCLPFPCMRHTPLVMAWEDSQHVYNPWLSFRLQELPRPEDWSFQWQNKELNPQLLCFCPSLPGVPVSFLNWTW